jgi:hypothetical protein
MLIPLLLDDSIDPDHAPAIHENNKTWEEQKERSPTCSTFKTSKRSKQYLLEHQDMGSSSTELYLPPLEYSCTKKPVGEFKLSETGHIRNSSSWNI